MKEDTKLLLFVEHLIVQVENLKELKDKLVLLIKDTKLQHISLYQQLEQFIRGFLKTKHAAITLINCVWETLLREINGDQINGGTCHVHAWVGQFDITET